MLTVLRSFTPSPEARPLKRYGIALLASVCALLLTRLCQPILQHSIFIFCLAAIVFSAWYGGSGTIRVRLSSAGDRLCLQVTDQGVGIPPEAMPALFTRFYRASNADEYGISGMGVGLFVVNEIITRHGGTVDVTSTPSQGSTFTVSLPFSTAPIPQPEQP